uniref:Sulfhydryl oxidase n=1 Tax=Ditylenchus dipsaci TaxID=166011 RepID=A0A915DZJ8_9BILA
MMMWSKKLAAKKEANKASFNGKADEKTPVVKRSDCPVNKDELGRSTWNLLHTIAAVFPDRPTDTQKKDVVDTLTSLSKTYPCAHCAEDFRKDLVENPPQVEDREKLSKWMCELHNRVNEKIGKDIFDCSRTNERWFEGWRDGSCD